MNQAEVNNLIREELDKYRSRIDSLGCSTQIGCLAGKKHFQMHEDKMKSDMLDFKNYIKDNNVDKDKTMNRLSEVTIMLHDIVANIANLTANHETLRKLVSKLDAKFLGMVVAIATMCVATVWGLSTSMSTNMKKITSTVASINEVDTANQTSTETYMILMLEELSGKSITTLLEEHKEKKPEVEKQKKGETK